MISGPHRLPSTAAVASLAMAGGVPAAGGWMKLLPAGAFASPRDGRRWNAGDRQAMEAIVAATLSIAGATELVVDYDHQSEFATIKGVGGRAPAAGWVKELAVRDDGIWGRIEWTEAAAAAILAQEYRYLSPTFYHEKSGRVLALRSAALTNTPALDDLVAAASALSPQPKDFSMDRIAAALGLAAGSTEDAIVAALAARTAGTSAIAKAAGLPDAASAEEIATAVAAARTPDPSQFVPAALVATLQAEVKALRDAGAAEKAELAVAAAIKDGKVAPALKEWALAYAKQDLPGFQQFTGGSPVLTKPQLTDPGRWPAGDERLDEAQLAACRAIGLDPETYRKTLAAEAKAKENA